MHVLVCALSLVFLCIPHVGNRRHRVACLIMRYSLIKLVTYLIKPISCSAVGV